MLSADHTFSDERGLRSILSYAAKDVRELLPAHLLVSDTSPGYATIFFVRTNIAKVRKILRGVQRIYDTLTLSPLSFEALMQTPRLGKVTNPCERLAQAAWMAVCTPASHSEVPMHLRAALAAGELNDVSKIMARLPTSLPVFKAVTAFLVRITTTPDIPAPHGSKSKAAMSNP